MTNLGGGAAITAGTPGNTLGSWGAISTSTPIDCCMLGLTMNYFNSTTSNFAYDIGVGAAGSEVVLISGLTQSNIGGSDAPTCNVMFPVHIPAGTRLSQRAQSTVASDANVGLGALMYDGSFTRGEGPAGYDTIGFSSNSRGTALVPNATAGTAGAYTQLVLSSARDYQGFFYMVDNQGLTGGGMLYAIDIAVGAGGSEQNISTGWLHQQISNTLQTTSQRYAELPIVAGTRISARCTCFSASGRNIGITFYGAWQ
jgi:hypothetical protein